MDLDLDLVVIRDHATWWRGGGDSGLRRAVQGAAWGLGWGERGGGGFVEVTFVHAYILQIVSQTSKRTNHMVSFHSLP